MTLAGAATGRNASSTETSGERRREIVDVAGERGLTRIGDGTDANRISGRGDTFARIELGIEFGKSFPVGAARERIGARFHWPALEPAQTFERILRPADALSELAVADHVDAGRSLPAHDLGDRLRQTGFVSLLIERLAGLLGVQEILQRLRPDQAADMGREDPIEASLHLPCWGAQRAGGCSSSRYGASQSAVQTTALS